MVPRSLPSLNKECVLLHPLQGASFLSTPLKGGILKPPALRVVVDFPIGGFSPPEGRLARGFKPPAFSRFLFQSAVKSAESF